MTRGGADVRLRQRGDGGDDDRRGRAAIRASIRPMCREPARTESLHPVQPIQIGQQWHKAEVTIEASGKVRA